MKLAAVLLSLFLIVFTTTFAAAQTPALTPTAAVTTTSPAPTSTPMRPTPTLSTRPPVGDFTVVPSSGPVGTVVTVSGDFDEDITGVRFRCFYHTDTIDEGLVDIPNALAQPAPSFSFRYQIPPTLSVRQGGGATVQTPAGTCQFLAMAGHKLLFASTDFAVTAPEQAAPVLPGSGARATGQSLPAWPFAALAVFGLGAVIAAGAVARRPGAA